MTTAIVLHRVEDFEGWRPVYDAFDKTRQQSGVTHEEVLRSQDDPNLVIVRHDFEDRQTAKAFFEDAQLKQAMKKAGVDTSSLQIHITEPS